MLGLRLGSRLGPGLETARVYEKVWIRNVWKPICLLLLPSCVGTGFMEDMDDVGRMKRWRILDRTLQWSSTSSGGRLSIQSRENEPI